ncbi:MAG: 1,4-alpha-glucan branching protein domain-containing protein [Solirubrobacteraceae bacterium]
MSNRAGELAIVLHTHMPYVEGGGTWPPADTDAYLRCPEGFGTWPFGEEWLWEAIATSYLPLLDVLGPPGRVALTLSLTPVLCDQLEHPGAIARCLRFLEEIRPESHRRDRDELERVGPPQLAAELDRSAADYAAAARRLRSLESGAGLLAALGAHAGWTSAATHAILPLLATDMGVALQVQTGVAAHRRRFGDWQGGFWSPECAHAPWLDGLLDESGVRATCVELTGELGLGDPRHLRPLISGDGLVLWPIDRQTIALAWDRRGYPSAAAYRDHHRLTRHRHRVWRNDGAPYDRDAAAAQARADARDFVDRVSRRVAGGGLCVFAVDAELLGHWWHEGPQWLRGVIEESARQGLSLTTLDAAVARHEPGPVPASLAGGRWSEGLSWGEGGDLRTWSAPGVGALAWHARSAELALAAAPVAGERALRELLALQSSDWAFQASGGIAGDYPLQRARGHLAALRRALAGAGDVDPRLRGLAPDLVGWA